MTDYAVLSLGAVSVPVYPTLPSSQVGAILDDCDAKIVFVSNEDQARKISGARLVVTFDSPLPDSSPQGTDRVESSGDAPRVTSLAAQLNRIEAEPDPAWRQRALAVSPATSPRSSTRRARPARRRV